MASTQTEQAVQQIPLNQIIPSKDNPRKTIDETSLAELASSIKENGVISPILLRGSFSSGGGAKMEIVFGERRFRASKLAGKETIPAICREMTDEQAEEERFIENAQREDLAPIEEARGYKILLGKGTIAEVAARTGKDEGHIAKRLSLLKMVEGAQKALESGKIQLGHALEIARLTPDNQNRVMKWVTSKIQVNTGQDNWVDTKVTITVDSLKQFIQNNLLVELSRATFDLTDATLNPKMGACTTCPHNTANQGALFSDVKAAKCTIPECFFGKQETDQERKLAALAEERGVKSLYRLSIGGGTHSNRGLGSIKVDGYYHSYSSSIALVSAGKECKFAQPAVVVRVEADRHDKEKKFKVGDETNVCVDSKCKEHHEFGSGSSTPSAPRKGLALVNHKETGLGASRKQRTRNEAFKQIAEKAAKDDSFPKALLAKLRMVLPYVTAHLYSDRWRDAGKAMGLEKPKASKYGTADWSKAVESYFKGNEWALILIAVMAEDLPASANDWRGKGSKGALSTMADFYKVDLAKISVELQKQDRELIKGMRERAIEKAKDKKPKKAKVTPEVKATKKG